MYDYFAAIDASKGLAQLGCKVNHGIVKSSVVHSPVELCSINARCLIIPCVCPNHIYGIKSYGNHEKVNEEGVNLVFRLRLFNFINNRWLMLI